MHILSTRNFKSISHQKIDYCDVEYIIRKAFGEKTKIKSVETTKQGDVNSSYIINLEHPVFKLFLKVEDNKNIPKFYSGQIEREVEGIKLCKRADIPCANIISFDVSCKDIGKKYILTEFITSNLLSEMWSGLNSDQKLKVKEEMLGIVNKMQNIKAKYFGDIYESGSIGKHSKWAESFKTLIDTALNDCLNLGSLNEEEIKLIKEATLICTLKLKTDYIASFNHMDIHWHNVFINKAKEYKEYNGVSVGDEVFYLDYYTIKPTTVKGMVRGQAYRYNILMGVADLKIPEHPTISYSTGSSK
jgi:hypothetical protein